MSTSMRTLASLSRLGADLSKEVMNTKVPSIVRCQDLVQAIEHESSQVNLSQPDVEQNGIAKNLENCVRAIKRHYRTANETERELWKALINKTFVLSNAFKSAVQKQQKNDQGPIEGENNAQEMGQRKATDNAAYELNRSGLPNSVAEYSSRLQLQKKEMYKNPPILPPEKVDVYNYRKERPIRRENGDRFFEDHTEFRPNRSPEEILRAGSFGGTYFRPIFSAVTNKLYASSDVLSTTVDNAWIEGLNKKCYLTSSTYQKSVNRYNVKCGGSLGMWESSGWISDVDPYGWFQWYCRFYQGRRTTDDDRQIGRWLKSAGPKGRFRSQLCNLVIKKGAKTKANDPTISPVIRQTLLHWGFELTEELLEKHRARQK